MSAAEPTSASYLEVDLAALERNFERLRDAARGGDVAAIVKANAYGLGMVPVARRLETSGCESFFVATLEEGSALRAAVSDSTIYVLEGVAAGCEGRLVEQRLRPVINTLEQAQRWLALGRPCALHIDTGMSRLGLALSDVEALLASTRESARAAIEIVMTHLACAEETETPLNRRQVECFGEVAKRFPQARTSIGNTAALFLGEAYSGDVVRPGIGLYGGNPFDDRDNPFEVVASLKAKVLQLRDIETESTVGYGATHIAVPGDRLAVVGVGYADGFPRQLGGRGFASVGGMRVPIVGRISMDLTCLDVTGLERDAIELGDYVELFGHDIEVEEVAALCGTINYEILSGLGARIERVHVG